MARRNKAAESKVYRLANTPCATVAVSDHPFTVDNGNAAPNATARGRSIGLNNRVVGGLLVRTWRAGRRRCPATRFSMIQPSCRAASLDLSSFGIDPAFKPGASSFQPDLASGDDGPMLRAYDCAGLASGPPTYSVTDAVTGLVVNPRPYCAQLYNPR